MQTSTQDKCRQRTWGWYRPMYRSS